MSVTGLSSHLDPPNSTVTSFAGTVSGRSAAQISSEGKRAAGHVFSFFFTKIRNLAERVLNAVAPDGCRMPSKRNFAVQDIREAVRGLLRDLTDAEGVTHKELTRRQAELSKAVNSLRNLEEGADDIVTAELKCQLLVMLPDLPPDRFAALQQAVASASPIVPKLGARLEVIQDVLAEHEFQTAVEVALGYPDSRLVPVAALKECVAAVVSVARLSAKSGDSFAMHAPHKSEAVKNQIEKLQAHLYGTGTNPGEQKSMKDVIAMQDRTGWWRPFTRDQLKQFADALRTLGMTDLAEETEKILDKYALHASAILHSGDVGLRGRFEKYIAKQQIDEHIGFLDRMHAHSTPLSLEEANKLVDDFVIDQDNQINIDAELSKALIKARNKPDDEDGKLNELRRLLDMAQEHIERLLDDGVVREFCLNQK